MTAVRAPREAGISRPGIVRRPDMAGGAGQRARSGARADIQGLRAVAVVVVVLDHLLAWPRGGFIGVDIFFVISGFLITSLLLREYEKTGSISFLGFYRRRIKRIMPAALLTLLVTVVAAYGLVNAGFGRSVAWDELWALGFGANWHLILQGADYMHANGPVSPVQHYWSLSVEEQFYFVWPWLMFLVIAAVGAVVRKAGVIRVALVSTIVAVIAGSLLWSLQETETNPNAAYFSTFSRGWELGVGALLALAVPLMLRIPDVIRPILAWSGIVGIAISLFVIGTHSPFPAPTALLPIGATALVIAAGTGHAPLYIPVLTNPVSVFVGDFSYSLYLWHFPVIIILGLLIKPTGVIYIALAAAIMLFCAATSYYLVERPLRDSLWLSGLDARERWWRRTARSKPLVSVVAVIGLLAAADLGVTAATIVRDRDSAAHAEALGAAAAALVAPPAATSTPSALDQMKIRLQNALAAADWPKLSPAAASLSTETASVDEWLKDGCLDVKANNVSRCVYGNTSSATRSAAVLGDSYAISYLPAIRGALGPSWKIQVLTSEQCPAESTLTVMRSGGDSDGKCDDHHSWVSSWLSAHHQDLVIIVDTPGTIGRIDGFPRDGDAQREAYRKALDAELKVLGPVAARTVVLASPPTRAKLQTCYTTLSAPADCVTSVLPADVLFAQAQQSAVTANSAKARFASTQAWFCINQKCPSFIGTMPATSDGGHLTEPASKALAPLLRSTLGGFGVPDTVGATS